jgi:hypothetical protein
MAVYDWACEFVPLRVVVMVLPSRDRYDDLKHNLPFLFANCRENEVVHAWDVLASQERRRPKSAGSSPRVSWLTGGWAAAFGR